MKKEYKKHEIVLDESNGTFKVKINGSSKTFSSLKSAQNAIDKQAVTTFKPIEVVIIDVAGGHHYSESPTKFTVRKVKLIEYVEDKGYRRQLDRFFRTESGDKITINRYGSTKIYPLAAFDELKKMAEERNKFSKIEKDAKKSSEKIGKEWDKMVAKNIDPRPDAE